MRGGAGAGIPLLLLGVLGCGEPGQGSTPTPHEPQVHAQPTPADLDGDGFRPPEDCDDADAEVHPGAEELSDDRDNDCDGRVLVGGGPFVMGSDAGDPDLTDNETPEHLVDVPAFFIGRTEVTGAAYQACIDAGACFNDELRCNRGAPGEEALPANCILWDQAADYCAFVGGRLPTEAEWEKAARGGCDILGAPCDVSPRGEDSEADEPLWPWGDEEPGCDRGAFNFTYEPDSCAPEGEHSGPQPVGSYPLGASPYGALDMAGNVAEWVQDCPGDYAVTPRDGQAQTRCPDKDVERVIRGGDYSVPGHEVRVARRRVSDAFRESGALGLRCAWDAPAAP